MYVPCVSTCVCGITRSCFEHEKERQQKRGLYSSLNIAEVLLFFLLTRPLGTQHYVATARFFFLRFSFGAAGSTPSTSASARGLSDSVVPAADFFFFFFAAAPKSVPPAATRSFSFRAMMNSVQVEGRGHGLVELWVDLELVALVHVRALLL